MSQGLTTSERLGRTCAWRWRSLALPSEFESVEPSSRLPPLRSRRPATNRGSRQSPRVAESYSLGGTHHLVQGHLRPSVGADRLQQVLECPFRRSRVERFIFFRSKASREAAKSHDSASAGQRRKQFEPPLLLGNQTAEEKVAIGQGERTAFAVTSWTGMGTSAFRSGAEHSVSESQARAAARCDLYGVCESDLVISLDIPGESSNPRMKLTVLISS